MGVAFSIFLIRKAICFGSYHHKHNVKLIMRNRNGRKWVVRNFRSVIAIIFSAILAFVAIVQAISWLPVVYYSILSGITFFTYALDKSFAVKGQRRIPETSLHIMELAGGWPGALVAQDLIRHKNRKTRFQIVFWLVMVMNCAAMIGFRFLFESEFLLFYK